MADIFLTPTEKNYSFIQSQKIQVFPCAYRGQYFDTSNNGKVFDPEARSHTEANYVNKVLKLAPKAQTDHNSENSYVVSWTSVIDATDNTKSYYILECVIGGYFIKLSDVSPTDLKGKWLGIKTLQLNLDNQNDDTSTPYTSILTNFDDPQTLAILDQSSSGGTTGVQRDEYYFHGVAFADSLANLENNSAYLQPIDANGNVNADACIIGASIEAGSGRRAIKTAYYTSSTSTSSTDTTNLAYPRVENSWNVATGNNSIAVGKHTEVSGTQSIAAGEDVEVSGDNTLAIGKELVATGDTQIVLGEFNEVTDEAPDAYYLVIGDGNGVGTRHNMFTIGKDGSINLTKESNGTVGTPAATAISIKDTVKEFKLDTDGSISMKVNGAGETTIDKDGAIAVNENKFKVSKDGELSTCGNNFVVNTNGEIITKTNDSRSTYKAKITASGDLLLNNDTVQIKHTGELNLNKDKFTVTSGGQTTVKGALTVDNSATVNGNLTVYGKAITMKTESSAADNLSVTPGTTAIKNTAVNVEGTTTITGGTTITGSTTILNTVAISGAVSINCDTDAENTNAYTGALIISGGEVIKKNLIVEKNTTVVGNLTINGNTGLTVNKNITAANITGANITGTNIMGTGTATFNNDLTIGAPDTFDKDTNRIATTSIGISKLHGPVKVRTAWYAQRARANNTDKNDQVDLLVGTANITTNTDGSKTNSYYPINTYAAQFVGPVLLDTHKVDGTDSTDHCYQPLTCGDIHAKANLDIAGSLCVFGETSASALFTINKKSEKLNVCFGNAGNTTANYYTASTFDVYGDGHFHDNGTAASGALVVDGNLSVGGTVEITKATTIKSSLTVSGAMQASTYNATSDIRKKQNIKDYIPSNSILDLPLHTFEYINDETHTQYVGCIAQELEKIAPEFISKDSEGYLSVQENKLIYALINEVKQLSRTVADLQEQLNIKKQ